MTNNLISFLKGITIFGHLTDGELLTIKNIIKEKYLNAGDLIFNEQSPRNEFYMIYDGEIELYAKRPFGQEKRLAIFKKNDFFGEGALLDDYPQSTTARATVDTLLFSLSRDSLQELGSHSPKLTSKIIAQVARTISFRMRQANTRVINIAEQYQSGKTRIEYDLLGSREVPEECYYGIQTIRASENFNITGVPLYSAPALVESLAVVKMAAAKANFELGLLTEPIADAIVHACEEIINGKLHAHFTVDMIQGGAGTSTNMNANEVIANRALEIMGYRKGQYRYCHPNNHVNLSQSTNDAYPTAVKIALIRLNKSMIEVLSRLIESFRAKGREFMNIVKMGRTQLQDAVPLTLGQEFEAYAVTLDEEIERLGQNARLFLEVNMGATAIGTGINAPLEFSAICIKHLREMSGLEIISAKNLIEATQDTGAFVMYSSAVKRLAVKLSKIANDLRLLSSGPRTGINEINLPPMQPGSSIMPGKVNPVIPEVVNQVAFKVIGNDITVTLGAEAGQLELNVMEPVIVESLIDSIEMLKNSMNVLRHKCIDGITANQDRCRELVYNSIGLVTALNPVLGYEASTGLAKEALERDKSVYELVLEKKMLSADELNLLLTPENMVKPRATEGGKG
jgi:aspartate ammonia-lyase